MRGEFKGVGVDLVCVSRCAEKLSRNPGMHSRLCGLREEPTKDARDFARVFAIKEACIKASGGEVSFGDLSVSEPSSGQPRVTWCSKDSLTFEVSVSWERDTVAAVAVCFER